MKSDNRLADTTKRLPTGSRDAQEIVDSGIVAAAEKGVKVEDLSYDEQHREINATNDTILNVRSANKEREDALKRDRSNSKAWLPAQTVPLNEVSDDSDIRTIKRDYAQKPSKVSSYLKKAVAGRNKPVSIGEEINNYGNIRATDDVWEGSNGTKGGFVSFKNPEDGFTAVGKILRTYAKNGFDTIEKIINRYAPPTENDTGEYISNVVKIVGKGEGEKLNDSDMAKVMQGIFIQETAGGRSIKMEDIIKGWKSSA